MLLSRFTSFGASSFSKPVYIFSLLILTVSLILTSLILSGGTSTSPVLRNFYLLSVQYNPSSNLYLNFADADTNITRRDTNRNTTRDTSKDNNNRHTTGNNTSNNNDTLPPEPVVSGSNKPADNHDRDHDLQSDLTFREIRVSYRALCVQSTNASTWSCSKSASSLPSPFNETTTDDPLSLLPIADLYRRKIAWVLPFWVALLGISASYILLLFNALPFLPFLPHLPAWTRKLSVATLGTASVAALAGMVLNDITASAVDVLVGKLTMDAVLVSKGSMVIAGGWAVFALVLLAFLGVAAVVTAEWGVDRAERVVEEQAEKVVGGVTGGRFPQTRFVGKGLRDLETVKGRAKEAGFDLSKGVRGNVVPGLGLVRGSLRKPQR